MVFKDKSYSVNHSPVRIPFDHSMEKLDADLVLHGGEEEEDTLHVSMTYY